MKTYVKPTVDVVELSVKENIAVLPSAINGSVSASGFISGTQTYVETVYDLTTANASVLNA